MSNVNLLPFYILCNSDNTIDITEKSQQPLTKELSEEEALKFEQSVATQKEVDPAQTFCILSKDKSFTMEFPTIEERMNWFEDIFRTCRQVV